MESKIAHYRNTIILLGAAALAVDTIMLVAQVPTRIFGAITVTLATIQLRALS